MTTQPTLQSAATTHSDVFLSPVWSLGTRVLFRFGVLYFTAYALLTQIILAILPTPPSVDIAELSSHPPIAQIVAWTGKHILHQREPVVYSLSGSGDKIFDWSLVVSLMLFAFLATVLWSALDRRRPSYPGLHKWFRLFLRFALAGQLISYGMVKIIPLQMSLPHLARLVEPIGNLSPMGMLWTSIGSSPAYERFAGSAELLGGLLLLLPATTVVGALIAAADMIQVFTLNMTYDVPVKLLSFHLLLMALFLLAPDLRRLAGFFFFHRTTALTSASPLFRSPRWNRIALGAQLVFGLVLLIANVYAAKTEARIYGTQAPRSPLYGIWNVVSLSVDGELPHPPVSGSTYPWKRLILEVPQRATIQYLDDSTQGYSASLDKEGMHLSLTSAQDQNWKSQFKIVHNQPGQMILEGSVGAQKLRLEVKQMDLSKFLLLNRGFHWVQEVPFNR